MSITPEEAYEILTKNNPIQYITGCLDFGTFYIFCTIPLLDGMKNKDKYLTGTIFDAIDKNSGKHFEYDITSDPDAYNNAKEISIKTVFDKPISEVIMEYKT